MTGIYTITNIVNSKIYIGESTDIEDRLNDHKYRLSIGNHANRYLQNAWNRYGGSNFKFEVLVECEVEYLKSEEHYWCMMLQVHSRNYGYNIKPTNPHKQGGVSIETINRIRIANTGKVQSKETIQKRISTGRERGTLGPGKHSEETKRKISESRKGVIPNRVYGPVSEEVRNKISITNKGREVWNKGISWNEETRKKISDTKKGTLPWNIGKSGYKTRKRDPEVGRKISQALVGRASILKGRKRDPEIGKRISETKRRKWEEKKNLIY